MAENTAATTEVTPEARGRRKERVGKVVSDKMDKTVIVSLTRQVAHPLYKKYFKKTTKFVAHNENNDAKIGDTVRIMETRPLSKTKRWRVTEIVGRAK
ncbi:MAG: 30S ribosomal protein S17 [Candidatus Kapaibacterium sp.]|jgi:small subunit ribosomal protein S17